MALIDYKVPSMCLHRPWILKLWNCWKLASMLIYGITNGVETKTYKKQLLVLNSIVNRYCMIFFFQTEPITCTKKKKKNLCRDKEEIQQIVFSPSLMNNNHVIVWADVETHWSATSTRNITLSLQRQFIICDYCFTYCQRKINK